MSKPNWCDAPVWAKWLAQDSDGEWFWYSEKPSLPAGKSGWIDEIGSLHAWACKAPNYQPFETTLERRP
ncbi:MAG: hypothetical protein [Caudoviricetes sp.]|nr:MAG: hypothetical protein [Caudoviricetes sp.]